LMALLVSVAYPHLALLLHPQAPALFPVPTVRNSWRPYLLARSYDEFEVLASDIRDYLGQIDPKLLEGPGAPSPLAYTELQRNGRTDLAEGCMKHGGYLKVSEALGVRVNLVAPPPPPAAPRFLPEDDSVGFGLALSASARESRLVDNVDVSAASNATPGSMAAPLPRDRLMPLEAASSPRQKDSDSPVRPLQWDVARATKLDSLQRASVLLLLVLASFGFGKSSGSVLDATAIASAQLGAEALLVAHLSMAAYAALLVIQGGQLGEPSTVATTLANPSRQQGIPASDTPSLEGVPPIGPPGFWFFKVALSGAGGLRELRALVER